VRFHEQKPDYFDLHRKDHSGRPILFAGAMFGAVVLWAAIIVVTIWLL
jgi:hypothetical protein